MRVGVGESFDLGIKLAFDCFPQWISWIVNRLLENEITCEILGSKIGRKFNSWSFYWVFVPQYLLVYNFCGKQNFLFRLTFRLHDITRLHSLVIQLIVYLFIMLVFDSKAIKQDAQYKIHMIALKTENRYFQVIRMVKLPRSSGKFEFLRIKIFRKSS